MGGEGEQKFGGGGRGVYWGRGDLSWWGGQWANFWLVGGGTPPHPPCRENPEVFEIFCKDNPNDKIKQWTFEQLWPKNVRLRRAANRMVCCCTIHSNINYLREAAIWYCNISNNSQSIVKVLSTNEDLCNYHLCPSATIACIQRVCNVCSNITLLDEAIMHSKELLIVLTVMLKNRKFISNNLKTLPMNMQVR